MKKYIFYYVIGNTVKAIRVDSDCTPNACIKAKKIVRVPDRRLTRCVLLDDNYSPEGIRENLMKEKRRIDEGRWQWSGFGPKEA